MKRDGRTLDHATLETIRLMAIERVAEAESLAAVIESYGFNRTTIYRWIDKVLRSRVLTPKQEQQVFRWVNGRDPRQYGPDFGLWTRAVVADLIERRFGL
jgi:transposase